MTPSASQGKIPFERRRTIRYQTVISPIASFCLSILAFSCAPPESQPEAELEAPVATDPQAQLREVAEEIINDNFAANRIEPMVPYIAPEVTVFGPAGTSRREGGERMIESLRRGAATKTTHRWEERDWKIQVYEDVGIVTFIYDHDSTRNGERVDRTSRATYVFHRRDGRWLLVHDHTSVMPPEMAEATRSEGAGETAPAPATKLPEPGAAPDPAVAERELLEIAQKFHDDYAANQVDPIVPYIAPDVTVFGPAGTPRREGGDRMIESLRRGAAAKITHLWEERDWKVQVYGGVGIITFIYDHDLTVNEVRNKRTSRATYVFHRREGRWMLVHDHTSPLSKPARISTRKKMRLFPRVFILESLISFHLLRRVRLAPDHPVHLG